LPATSVVQRAFAVGKWRRLHSAGECAVECGGAGVANRGGDRRDRCIIGREHFARDLDAHARGDLAK
jgi:hypothetical protein